jgi:hypothetical protein
VGRCETAKVEERRVEESSVREQSKFECYYYYFNVLFCAIVFMSYLLVKISINFSACFVV